MSRFLTRHFTLPLDNELEQAALRIAVSLGIYLCLLPAFFGAEPHPAAAEVSMALLGFLALALAILLAMRLAPWLAPWPRLIGNVADVAMTSFSMIATGLDGAALFFVYLFITIGNGFRFGRRYLDISLGLSLIGFAAVLRQAPFWRENHGFGIGVAIGLVAISLYARTLIRRLYTAIEHAEVANEAKRRFLSTVTHELRTPLNAIQGMHDLLRETELDVHQREMLTSISTASNAMLGLVEDVLDFSKIEAGKIVLEDAPFDLRELVDGMVRLLEPQARAKGLRLVTRLDARLHTALRGDAFRLRQVLLNLVGNALKFTERGRVELAVERLEPDAGAGQRLRFVISDTGIGMSAEALTRIFDSFTQADDSTTRRFGGTGLGTTISRQLVQLFGGELKVESTPGQGSRFWFDIALASVSARGDAAADARPRCLAVGFAPATLAGLEAAAVELVQAEQLATAFSAIDRAFAESRPFALVLVWGGLPQEDVVELGAALHRLDAAPRLALCDPAQDARLGALCRSIGYADVLPWPLAPGQLAREATRPGGARSDLGLAEQFAALGGRPGLRLLVADDNLINQEVARRILELVGCCVTLVADGEQALDAAEAGGFDLIVLDMNMPGLGGLEVAQTLAHIELGRPRTPLVMLTANATPEVIEASRQVGIAHFLSKPVSALRLIATVAEATAVRPTA
ncbi:ATP-binding protein [Derxia lacustris]|uniref:ATP-binding protein n=1 Tax=Derxia lacustris TaxID=764842 RepID=UPI000A177438|nr:ATP-binding protein [Derxia lacustris]